jgi:hypothetical protein
MDPALVPAPAAAPMPLSRKDILLNAGTILDAILLVLGISFASVKIQDPGNTTFTPTVIMSLFVSTILLTGVIILFSEITNPAILFTFATFALVTLLLTFSSILIRMRYYASN